MTNASVSSCFAARPSRVFPVITLEGWTIKPYRILGRPDSSETNLPDATLAAIRSQLPMPAIAPRRPGVAFVIEHLATPLDYIVLCWWQNNNELITRIFVRESGAPWRLTAGDESFCVWDLDIIWFERNAFVLSMLAPATPDLKSYINARFEKDAAG